MNPSGASSRPVPQPTVSGPSPRAATDPCHDRRATQREGSTAVRGGRHDDLLLAAPHGPAALGRPGVGLRRVPTGTVDLPGHAAALVRPHAAVRDRAVRPGRTPAAAQRSPPATALPPGRGAAGRRAARSWRSCRRRSHPAARSVCSPTGGYLDGGDGSPASPGISTVKFPPQQQTVIIEQSDNIRAAAAVSPAVVTITSSAAAAATARRRTGSPPGSSTTPRGWILTNRHVVCGADALIVRLADGRQFTGQTYGIDTLTDLAIVHVDGPTLPAASIGDSSALKPGQLSLAIGSSLGTLTTSVTSGVVSALGRDVVVDDACGTGPAAIPAQPHPDGRGHQSRQLRRRARQRERRRDRHQHGRRGRRAGHRVRDPHQHRQAHHAAGHRRQAR